MKYRSPRLFKRKVKKEPCLYFDKCPQEKDFEACINGKGGCIIYSRLEALNQEKSPTGLERFLPRLTLYKDKQKAEDPEEEYLGIGAMKVVPGEGTKIKRRGE